MARQGIDAGIVGFLPAGGLGVRCGMALGRRAARGRRAAVKLDGTGSTVALPAGFKVGPGLRAMQGRIGERYGVGRTRAVGMTARRRAVCVGKGGRKAAWRIRMKTGGVRLDIMANGTGNVR